MHFRNCSQGKVTFHQPPANLLPEVFLCKITNDHYQRIWRARTNNWQNSQADATRTTGQNRSYHLLLGPDLAASCPTLLIIGDFVDHRAFPELRRKRRSQFAQDRALWRRLPRRWGGAGWGLGALALATVICRWEEVTDSLKDNNPVIPLLMSADHPWLQKDVQPLFILPQSQ